MIETSALTDPPAPWGRYDLSGGKTWPVRIGPRDLWLRRNDGEIWLALGGAASAGGNGDAPDTDALDEPPGEKGWSRWATAKGESAVVLRPVFPDRALVLEPERPFRLLPDAEARVYVRVPLWVRIELPLAGTRGSAEVLDEFPLHPLSDTWWGGHSHGELAYWLPTTARREMRAELWAPHLAVCPLVMTNRSSDDLRVEKLAFRVAHLSLYACEGHFWADEALITYLGEGEGTQVEMAGEPPPEAPDGQLVTVPRTPALRGFRARTFGRLAAMPLLGGGD